MCVCCVCVQYIMYMDRAAASGRSGPDTTPCSVPPLVGTATEGCCGMFLASFASNRPLLHQIGLFCEPPLVGTATEGCCGTNSQKWCDTKPSLVSAILNPVWLARFQTQFG